MNENSIERLLLLEDNPGDARLIRGTLNECAHRPSFRVLRSTVSL